MLDEPTIDPIPLHPSLPALRACLARAASPSAIRAAFRDLLDADQDETDPREGALLDRLDWTDLDLTLLPRGTDGGQQAEKVITASNGVAGAREADDTVSEDRVELAIAEGLRLSREIRRSGSGFLRCGEAEDWLLASDFEEAVDRLDHYARELGPTRNGDPTALLVYRHLAPQLAALHTAASPSGEASASGDGSSSTTLAADDEPARRPSGSIGSRRDSSVATGSSIRLQLLSDLHLDVWSYRPEIADGIDAIVVAGDVREDAVRAVRWLEDGYGAAGVPIVYVTGNHEGYGQTIEPMLERARREAAGTQVRLLENDEIVLHVRGVRFRVLGATLWTDLAIDGPKARERALRFGSRVMNDYRYIRTRTDEEDWHADGRVGIDASADDPSVGTPGSDESRRITAADTLQWHEAGRAWLTERLGEPHHGPTLVVTHHAPHPASLDRAFDGDGTHPFFASDLSALIEERGPDVWVHGHVHQRRDYRVGGTKIVCNPRGYPGERTGFIDPFIIEVPADDGLKDQGKNGSEGKGPSDRVDPSDRGNAS